MPVRNKYGPHGDKDETTITENCVAFWKKRPILKLVLVIIFNGVASMAFAALFIKVMYVFSIENIQLGNQRI